MVTLTYTHTHMHTCTHTHTHTQLVLNICIILSNDFVTEQTGKSLSIFLAIILYAIILIYNSMLYSKRESFVSRKVSLISLISLVILFVTTLKPQYEFSLHN